MENNTDFQFALLSLCFKNLSSSKKKLLINSQKEDEKNTLKSEPVFLGARDERNLVSLRSGFPFFAVFLSVLVFSHEDSSILHKNWNILGYPRCTVRMPYRGNTVYC